MKIGLFKKFWKSSAITIGVTGTLVTPLFANYSINETQKSAEEQFIYSSMQSLHPKLFSPYTESTNLLSSANAIKSTPNTIYNISPLPALPFSGFTNSGPALFHQYNQLLNGFKRLGFEKKDIDAMTDALVLIGARVYGFLPDSYQSKFEDGVKLFSDRTKLQDIVDKKNQIGKLTANDTLRVFKPRVMIDVFTAGAYVAGSAATGTNDVPGTFDDGSKTPVFTQEPSPFVEDSFIPHPDSSEEEYKNAIYKFATSDRIGAAGDTSNDEYMNNFMWKIGVIDTKALTGTEAFALSVADTGDVNVNNVPDSTEANSAAGKKELQIVFSNASDLLSQGFGATDSTYRTIEDLVKTEYIYIRDMRENAFDFDSNPGINHSDPTYSEIKWADNIYLARSKSDEAKIDMYIRPKSYHVNDPIISESPHFEISIPEDMKQTEFVKKSGFTFGVLDHSANNALVRNIDDTNSESLATMWTANNNMWNGVLPGPDGFPLNNNPDYFYNQDPQWIISSFNYSPGFNELKEPGVNTLGDYFPRTWSAYDTNSKAYVKGSNYINWRIYHSVSNWRSSDLQSGVFPSGAANHIRFFMFTGTEMNFQLKIMKNDGSYVDKSYFEGGSDKLKIAYDYLGNTPSVTEREYVIDANVFANIVGGDVEPQYVNVKTYPAPSISSGVAQYFAKVDIILTKGKVMFNPNISEDGEDPLSLENVSELSDGRYQRIFFTPPRGIRPDTNIQGLDTVKFGSKSKVDNYYEQIVANVYGIWSGHRESGIDYNEVKFVLDNDIYTWYSGVTNPNLANGAVFPFSYNSYYFTTEEGLILKGIYSEIIEEDENGKDIYDGTVQRILPSTGYNITYKLNDYSNKLSTWTADVLGATPETPLNKYRIEAFADAIPFYTNVIENNTLSYGPKIMSVAKVLYKYWKGQNLTTDESILLAEISALAESKDVTFNTINELSGTGKDANNPTDTSDPDDPYTRQLAIIYEIVSWYWADALTYLIQYEQNQFELIKGTILGKFMSSYLSSAESTSIAINSAILRKVPSDKLLPGHDTLNLLILGTNPIISARNGYEELKSLLDFIQVNNLHAKYLSSDNAASFNEKYDSLIDADSYINPEKIRDSRTLIRLLDVIVREIIGGDSNVRSLTDIINAILDGTIVTTGDTAVGEIRNTIRASIKLITNQQDREFKYSYFGISETTTYLENIVIGNNLGEAIKLYILKNQETLSEDEIERLTTISGREAYSTDTITKIAINLKYYNLRLFLDKLLDENRVSSIVEEIANSKLEIIDNIDIPKTNDLLNYLSNPESLSSFVMTFIGGILIAISVFSLLTSFKKYVKQGGKSMIVTRLIFIVLLSIGLVIAGLGILPLVGVL